MHIFTEEISEDGIPGGYEHLKKLKATIKEPWKKRIYHFIPTLWKDPVSNTLCILHFHS